MITDSAIEKELAELVNLDHNKCLGKESYLYELLAKVTKTDDAEWETLSKDAQDWVVKATEAFNNAKSLPSFPDASEQPKRQIFAEPVRATPTTKPSSPKQVKTSGRRSSRSSFNPDAVITKVHPNPRKPGTKVYNDYLLYEVGMTLGEAMEKGASRESIRGELQLGYIEVDR